MKLLIFLGTALSLSAQESSHLHSLSTTKAVVSSSPLVAAWKNNNLSEVAKLVPSMTEESVNQVYKRLQLTLHNGKPA